MEGNVRQVYGRHAYRKLRTFPPVSEEPALSLKFTHPLVPPSLCSSLALPKQPKHLTSTVLLQEFLDLSKHTPKAHTILDHGAQRLGNNHSLHPELPPPLSYSFHPLVVPEISFRHVRISSHRHSILPLWSGIRKRVSRLPLSSRDQTCTLCYRVCRRVCCWNCPNSSNSTKLNTQQTTSSPLSRPPQGRTSLAKIGPYDRQPESFGLLAPAQHQQSSSPWHPFRS